MSPLTKKLTRLWTPATAAAQLKREFPAWSKAKMCDSADNSKNGYWDLYLDLRGSTLACQYCANSGYWLEIQSYYGRPIVDSDADYYPSLAEAIAALRQAAAQQMQVLKTLGDAHGN
jgi:hypothetical protein